MKNLTFILVSRCDNYSCQNKDNYDEQIAKVLLPIKSAQRAFPDCKFILVEYCPGNNPRYKDVLPRDIKNVKIITLNEELHTDLQLDGNIPQMNFYEHVGKHIGILNTDTEFFSYINQDIILPDKNNTQVINYLRSGCIVVGYKDKIPYSLMNSNVDGIIQYCNESPQSHEHGTWGNGDFIAMSRQLYFQYNLNNFWKYHQNWGMDNIILKLAGLTQMDPVSSQGINIVRPYVYFSLDHPSDGMNRPNVGNITNPFGENAKPIESQELIKKINGNYYIQEIVEL